MEKRKAANFEKNKVSRSSKETKKENKKIP